MLLIGSLAPTTPRKNPKKSTTNSSKDSIFVMIYQCTLHQMRLIFFVWPIDAPHSIKRFLCLKIDVILDFYISIRLI